MSINLPIIHILSLTPWWKNDILKIWEPTHIHILFLRVMIPLPSLCSGNLHIYIYCFGNYKGLAYLLRSGNLHIYIYFFVRRSGKWYQNHSGNLHIYIYCFDRSPFRALYSPSGNLHIYIYCFSKTAQM